MINIIKCHRIISCHLKYNHCGAFLPYNNFVLQFNFIVLFYFFLRTMVRVLKESEVYVITWCCPSSVFIMNAVGRKHYKFVQKVRRERFLSGYNWTKLTMKKTFFCQIQSWRFKVFKRARTHATSGFRGHFSQTLKKVLHRRSRTLFVDKKTYYSVIWQKKSKKNANKSNRLTTDIH